jgi:putative oxidoreductase
MAGTMTRLVALHDRAIALASSRPAEGAALLLTRVALAGVFWRSGRSKIEDGTLFTISKGTRYLFAEDYAAVPLPPDIAVVMATAAEHVLPILLVLGLATRFSALGLICMTMVIQIFVFPEAWWTVHALWTAMALVLVTRGAGLFSLDALIGARRRG